MHGRSCKQSADSLGRVVYDVLSVAESRCELASRLLCSGRPGRPRATDRRGCMGGQYMLAIATSNVGCYTDCACMSLATELCGGDRCQE